MGAGALSALEVHDDDDIEGDGPRTGRYYCHTCHRTMNMIGMQFPADLNCPLCQSTFLEELSVSLRPSPFEAGGLRSQRSGNLTELTAQQSRRLANAAAMLRILESRLYDELDFIQRSTAAMAVDAENKLSPLTLTQMSKLKTPTISVDLCCSQPSCPLCMEDYKIEEAVTQLPCSHIFHNECVLPWMNMKNSCPICRECISNELPTLLELEARFTEEELTSKIKVAKDFDSSMEKEGDKEEEADMDGNNVLPNVRDRDIAGVVRSTLSSRLAGTGRIREPTESETKAVKKTPPRSPSKRELAEELRSTLELHAKHAEASSPLPLPLRLPAMDSLPWRTSGGGPRVLGDPPYGMEGGMEIPVQLDRDPRLMQQHPRMNPGHAQRFALGQSQSSSNEAILMQLRALNRALEESPGDVLPEELPSLGVI